FLDRKTEQVYRAIGKRLEGYEIDILDRDTARNRFIVQAFTDKDPGAIYYYDMVGNTLLKLTDNNPALRGHMLAEMKPITYHSRDGHQIQGYLTMPPKAKGRKVPVIVYPHGGPSTRSKWGFNPVVQFF